MDLSFKKLLIESEKDTLIKSYDEYAHMIDDGKKHDKVQARNKEIIAKLKELGLRSFRKGDQTIKVK